MIYKLLWMKNFFYLKQCKYIFYYFILIICLFSFRIGGVFLTSHKSKIRVDNTLDKRLELLRQNATPQIRKLLFGQENEGKNK